MLGSLLSDSSSEKDDTSSFEDEEDDESTTQMYKPDKNYQSTNIEKLDGFEDNN